MRASCVICTDLFDEFKPICSLVCGHVFHNSCISDWMNTSHTCPHCRQKASVAKLTILFFTFVPEQGNHDAGHLENQVSTLKGKVSELEMQMKSLRTDKEQLRDYVKIAEEKEAKHKQTMFDMQSELETKRLIVRDLKKKAARVAELEKLVKDLTDRVELLRNVETVISGTQKDIDDMLKSMGASQDSAKQLSVYCSMLKRELLNASEAKQKLRTEVGTLRRGHGKLQIDLRQSREDVVELKQQLEHVEQHCQRLEQARAEPTASSSGSQAAIAQESPAPERMNESVYVTPISDRTNHIFPKRLKVVRHEEARIMSFPKAKLPSQKSPEIEVLYENHLDKNNADSKIRCGYDGLGGHSRVIVPSAYNFKKKPPRKLK